MRKAKMLFLCFFILFFAWTNAEAITVTASSLSVSVNQPVTFTITDTFTVPGYTCNLEINFGDDANWYFLGTCSSLTSPCTFPITHVYTTPGNYVVTARRTGCIPASSDTVTINVRIATLSANAVPSSFSVPRGIATTKSITYNLWTTPATNTTVYSTRGQFVGAGQVLGEVNTPLTVRLRNGTGGISETITILPGVIKRAEKLKITRFQYVRSFSNSQLAATVQVNISITTEAGAPFQITRLRLYFENNRAEITVKRNYPSLKAFAEVRFIGSGLLRAYWEIDGRILSYVYKHLVYGRSIVFETPQVPQLPTFDPGTHILKFVIVEPDQDIPLPVAIYYVTAEEYRVTPQPIFLVSPGKDSEIPYAPLRFEWKAGSKPAVFVIEFYANDDDNKPVFSAYTREENYELKDLVVRRVFAPGRTYIWKVKGFDENRNTISESKEWKFTFEKQVSYVPGQIVMALKKNAKRKNLIERLKHKYRLKTLEQFDLLTLKWQVFVFETDKDVLDLVSKLSKEDGVVLVQPNYIFRTMTDPLTPTQNIYRILNLEKVHKYYTGKNVLVAVIDTGVDTEHKDLKGNVVATKNFMDDKSYKPEIHGTAVAGTIAARVNNFGIEGVAPDAKLVACRACKQLNEQNPEGECYSVCLAKALDNALAMEVAIINMSFGSDFRDPLLSRLISWGGEKRTIFVAAVGRSSTGKAISFPASHPDVIAVASSESNLPLSPAGLKATKTLIYAPSRNILTTVPGNDHNFLSGTSLSTAVVTGIIALAKEKDKELDKNKIPSFQSDIGKWEESLLQLSIYQEESKVH